MTSSLDYGLKEAWTSQVGNRRRLRWRAYYRDAQVVILDEPTASLDALAEYELFKRFAELTEGEIALLISHRFSTVRMADRTVVLEDGRIGEQGNHDQLLSLGGQYAALFELQASSYRGQQRSGRGCCRNHAVYAPGWHCGHQYVTRPLGACF